MLRIFLEIVLPFLLPFIAFFGYRLLMRRGQALLASPPWYALTIGGLVLVCVSLVALAFRREGPVEGIYVPPHLEDGRVVPGEIRPPAPADG